MFQILLEQKTGQTSSYYRIHKSLIHLSNLDFPAMILYYIKNKKRKDTETRNVGKDSTKCGAACSLQGRDAPMDSTAAERLKRVAGKHTLKLTHYGRKTGKPHGVTIWFIGDRDKIYLTTGNVNRQWVKNVKQTPRVRLSVGGETFDGEARFLDDPAERDRVMSMAMRKYWMFLPMISVWRLLAALGIVQFATGAFEVRLSKS